jgi:signal transduction histidine kinase
VFLNLFDNAVKYLDKPAGRIELRCRAVKNGWEFAVTDNGPGIPARYHDKLFQMFQKLPPAAGSAGPGIGLAVVRRIVETRGGRVGVETQEGLGTTITVFWPDYPEASRGTDGLPEGSSPENGRAAPPQ